MATIKAVSSKKQPSLVTVIEYVQKKEKTELRLMSGWKCSPDTVLDEMMATKELWEKTDGRQYKHYVQSFHKDENITPEQVHDIAMELVKRVKVWENYEVLVCTHQDKDHLHTHFIINSVSIQDGRKYQESVEDLQNLKDISDEILRERGLHVVKKGKKFHGEERLAPISYNKYEYLALKKADEFITELQKAGADLKPTDSWKYNIALSVILAKEQATSREEFIGLLADDGIAVDWQDNHKYITFIDIDRQKSGESKYKCRNNKLEKAFNINFGKDDLENGFEVNRQGYQKQYTRVHSGQAGGSGKRDRTVEEYAIRAGEQEQRIVGIMRKREEARLRQQESEAEDYRASGTAESKGKRVDIEKPTDYYTYQTDHEFSR